MQAEYPDSAALFADMVDEEDVHCQQLIALHETRFGAFIPLIWHEHVAGLYARQPIRFIANLAASEARHKAHAESLSQNLTSSGAAKEEGFQAKRQFILTWA